MQLPGAYEYNVSGGDGALTEIYSHGASPFFDHDQFYLHVPVRRHVGEVQRNGTEISRVGKFFGSVAFCLVIVLVFAEIHGKTGLLSGCLSAAERAAGQKKDGSLYNDSIVQ